VALFGGAELIIRTLCWVRWSSGRCAGCADHLYLALGQSGHLPCIWQRIWVKRGIDQRIPLPCVCAPFAGILPLRRCRPQPRGRGL